MKKFTGTREEYSRAEPLSLLDDETRHVAIGTKHFLALAHTRGEAPEESWKKLVQAHFKGALKPPFNDSARLAAGLSREFYEEVAH